MRINYNVQAMNANLALNQADDRVSQCINRLSSGLKVAAAKDNPSGYAMSKRMNLQIEGLSRATQSSNDAISVISIADGALSEVSDMIQRISELATKAANATMTDEDRQLCQDEVAQLKKEIERVAGTTEFNGQTLMDGSFDLKGYTNNLDLKVATYSDSTPVGVYKLDSLMVGFAKDADGNGYIDEAATITANESLTLNAPFPDGAKVSGVDGNLIKISAPNDFEITIALDENFADTYKDTGTVNVVISPAKAAGATPTAPLTLDITGLGAMDMQIGANEDQIIEIRIPTLSLQLMSMDDIDVSTVDGAASAMEDTKKGLEYVSNMRSRLGAYQNRLEHTVSTLDVTNVAMTSAYSGLVDADMAEETVNYSTQQIVSQAATSVLAQANDRPSQALQLLQ